MNDTLWQTKLAARLHDPAEKALVLLRDPAGHEGGTTAALRTLLALTKADTRAVERADWWAAAADRPQWPEDLAARVNFARSPVLIHPLTGERFELHDLTDVNVEDAKDKAFRHFKTLLETLGIQGSDAADWRKVLLAFWRFGPALEEEKDNAKLGALWELLPADTRVPDHSIWDHLDLTSAFAGAFVADPEGKVALLALSIGPVQPFIAAARKVEDLWAGSHLLSRLAWEAMRPVAEKLGPDAILFPRLRGIPQVDLWLRDVMKLPDALFEKCEWKKSATDANPLFAAALPNRFVAVVPQSEVQALVGACEKAVRDWLLDTGLAVVDRLLEEAGYKKKDEKKDDPRDESIPAYKQMREQLAGFPEVHWAAVPFFLIRCRDEAKQRDLDTAELSKAMAPFFGVAEGEPCGFLASPAWRVLQREIAWGGGTTFHAPNPGVLYPAVYDLAERVLAAAKSVRAFEQTQQQGWRDSLTGEAEWLTVDRDKLNVPPGQRTDTLWAKIANKRPAWAKEGEHLSALSAIKRLWPTLFAKEVGEALGLGKQEGANEDVDLAPTGEEVGKALGLENQVKRFVVSTHTMALAHQLDRWLEKGGHITPDLADRLRQVDRVALPRKLLRDSSNPALDYAKRLPALLEEVYESDDEGRRREIEKLVRQTLAPAFGKQDVRLETYYALLMMDGDRMGAILSGDDSVGCAISYRESFHPDLRDDFDKKASQQPLLAGYGNQKRPPSPNRHLAISGALNDFSQHVVPHVVEIEHLGKLIYAGGDDVLAMLPVADVLSCMERLRHAYSGTSPHDDSIDWKQASRKKNQLFCKKGFALLNGRLMRMMGEKATASCGAVVAHHQAPLSAVLRELRATEKRAKDAGRNRFSITIIKRSGGTLSLTAPWKDMRLLADLRDFLTREDTSRRAVYHSLQWLKDLPKPPERAMLESLLAYQLARQSKGAENTNDLSRRLAARAIEQQSPLDWLRNFLMVAEFLARETRVDTETLAAAQLATEGAAV